MACAGWSGLEYGALLVESQLLRSLSWYVVLSRLIVLHQVEVDTTGMSFERTGL